MSSAKKIELMMIEERVIPSPDLLSSAPKLDTKIANSSGDKLQPVNYDFKINICEILLTLLDTLCEPQLISVMAIDHKTKRIIKIHGFNDG